MNDVKADKLKTHDQQNMTSKYDFEIKLQNTLIQ